MKVVLFVLVTLFVAIALTLATVDNPGYVLIARPPWSVEMPLTLFVPLCAIGFVVTYALLYVLLRLARIPRDVARWRLRRQTRRARAALTHGFIKLAEGEFAAAETELQAGLRQSEAPLLNFLAAAYCAQEQGLIEKRDEYLAAAERVAPQHALAVGMMQARLQQVAGQHEQALATLTELKRSQPRHRYTLKLLAKAYQELRDWTGIAELVSDLRAQAILPADDVDALELRTHKELLQLSLPSGSHDVLVRAWGAVPKSLRQHPALLAIYVRQLIHQNEMQEAEAALRAALEREWDSELAVLYGQVYGEHAAEQLLQAESWLAAHTDDAGLLLACGRLAMRANDLTKARNYFEKSIALNGPAEAYRELGGLLERLGEKDKAVTTYRRGLEAYLAERAGARRGAGAPPRYRLVR